VEYTFCQIKESPDTMECAVKILLESMPKAEMWPDLDKNSAVETVKESIDDENICIGIKIDDELIGWVCVSPEFEQTWELHPMVIKTEFQGKGFGKILINEAEKIAREKGIIGIILGSGEETYKTSLSQNEITKKNLLEKNKNIKNYKNHPYEFYRKCGYCVYGIIPNAYGLNKPNILMWKDIRGN
jgi:aminoglycoside 6'-N-acetyltransferase I